MRSKALAPEEAGRRSGMVATDPLRSSRAEPSAETDRDAGACRASVRPSWSASKPSSSYPS